MIEIDWSQLVTAEAKGQHARAAAIAAIRAEAQRRIVALTGASDLQSCLIKQLNAQMRATELSDIRLSGAELTPADEAEAQALRDLAAAIKAIRAAGNVLEAADPIPTDYTDDVYWT